MSHFEAKMIRVRYKHESERKAFLSVQSMRTVMGCEGK